MSKDKNREALSGSVGQTPDSHAPISKVEGSDLQNDVQRTAFNAISEILNGKTSSLDIIDLGEIKKADPAIFDALVQATGRKDFDAYDVIVKTSNIGSELLKKASKFKK